MSTQNQSSSQYVTLRTSINKKNIWLEIFQLQPNLEAVRKLIASWDRPLPKKLYQIVVHVFSAVPPSFNNLQQMCYSFLLGKLIGVIVNFLSSYRKSSLSTVVESVCKQDARFWQIDDSSKPNISFSHDSRWQVFKIVSDQTNNKHISCWYFLQILTPASSNLVTCQ